MTLVLASTSRYRRALLDRMGVPYECEAPDFDEVAPQGVDPPSCAALFARGKALAVAARRPGDLVIGADQTLECDGASLRKPRDLDEATAQLLSLSGRWHRLHSAVALAGPAGQVREGLATVELRMRPLSPAQAARYVALDRPEGCVGGYTFEQRGFALFDEVRGADDSTIVGMPLWLLARLLRDAGVDTLSP